MSTDEVPPIQGSSRGLPLVTYLPLQIPQADAWALAQPFDWPGLLLPADSARVVWVPVDPRSGAVQP